MPQEGLEPPLLSEADFESAASTSSATGANKYHMQDRDDYMLKLLYQLAKNQPYQLQSSYVAPGSEFKPMFPPPGSKLFVPSVIPKLKK